MTRLSDRPSDHRRGAGARRADIDRRLFARRDQGDPSAREELIERFMPLARSIALRYEQRGEPMDDLLQVASMALVHAVDRFDPHLGNAFSSYAVPTIAGEIKRYFRDRAWAVRPPRDVQELTLRVDAAVERLGIELNRAPTVAEISESVGERDELVLEAMQARGAYKALSFEGPTGGSEDPGALQDMLGSEDDGYAGAEARAVVDRLMRCLTPRERIVVRLRFEDDLTQAEIGALLGVSQMQISRILRKAIERLRGVAERDAPGLAMASGATEP